MFRNKYNSPNRSTAELLRSETNWSCSLLAVKLRQSMLDVSVKSGHQLAVLSDIQFMTSPFRTVPTSWLDITWSRSRWLTSLSHCKGHFPLEAWLEDGRDKWLSTQHTVAFFWASPFSYEYKYLSVEHGDITFSPGIWDAEVGRSLWVQSQACLHGEL